MLLHDADCLERLSVTIPRAAGLEVKDPEQEWLKDEAQTLETFFIFLMQLCSFRAWSQVQFSVLLPQALACVHLEDVHERQAMLDRVHALVDAVLQAEAVVYNLAGSPMVSPATRREVAAILHQVGWNALQLAREGIGVAAEAAWTATNEELRLWSFAVFARPSNTKFMLEDVFNHVSDMSRRQSKNHVMQRRGLPKARAYRIWFLTPSGWNSQTNQLMHRWTRYLYVIATPIVRLCNWPQVAVRPQEFVRRAAAAATSQHRYKKAFKVGRDSLPDELRKRMSPLNLAKKYKAAGVASNQRAAAATAWLVHHAPLNQWELCGFAWAGHGLHHIMLQLQ